MQTTNGSLVQTEFGKVRKGKLRLHAITRLWFLGGLMSLIPAGVAQAQCTGCAPPTPYTGWHPPLVLREQFQLSGVSGSCATGGFNTNVSGTAVNGSVVVPDVYNLDLYADWGTCPKYAVGTLNTDAVNAVHAQGKHVICYIDIGSSESYRPDNQDLINFNNSCGGCLLGRRVSSGSYWLNINNDKGQRDFLVGFMTKRLAKCQQAGFDGAYFDLPFAWQARTGFTISANTQELYNTAMLNAAHSYNLAVGLNYDLPQVADLQPYEDFHVDEQCFQYGECNYLLPVVNANKPVFEIEYSTSPSTVCPQEPGTYNWNTEFKSVALLDYPWQTCR